ncbi:MYB and HSA domain-containing protein [Pyrenophora tritici-repentis]|nr:MYB and HSA domain-containing protein [Pyrenophora tritici-repentis]KAI0591127.1 MYB and HSA domain-containing protein [Pyrenophora tritici-repentis]PZD43394.1 MYB and HSA domain containing protein [Pyrenophora tritici-repentis]
MSLDSLRETLRQEKTNEAALTSSTLERHLRALWKVTGCCNAVLNGHQPQADDFVYGDPDEDERRFLDENDITNRVYRGRRFNDATLPIPVAVTDNQPPLPATLPFQTPTNSTFTKPSHAPIVGTPTLEDQLRAASASPSVATQALPSADASLQSDTINVVPGAKASSHPASPALVGKVVSESQPGEAPTVQQVANSEDSAIHAPTADPKHVAPPTTEDLDAAAFPDASVAAPAADNKPKPPQVVHLPRQEVQEARLEETEQKLERAAEKERREDERERLTIPPTNVPVDVSSPSSTVGPYSQATPHAQHHSPDTSPDAESYKDRSLVPLPGDDVLDPAAQQVKDDHERALQKRMDEARENARAREEDSPTPDIEKQIENEQAIRLARDGKGHLSELQPSGDAHTLTEDLDYGTRTEVPEVEEVAGSRTHHDVAVDSLPTPTTVAAEPPNMDHDKPEHTVSQTQAAADHPTPPADVDVEMHDAPTKNTQPSTSPQPSIPRLERMTTRVSSGAIRQKSVSEIIAEKAAPNAILTPRSSNLSESTSPPRQKAARRKSREISTVVFAKKTPTRASKALQSYNEDYASLQGASEDSSRDYLEGLFKYQAHHPPRSVPLQELVASARKTVSTAGTLAMIREHQDYKILKRVYQLQNANRWSLRQLQKAAEPERPFTHQDQLLLDMKWMQTDFKEERKWKKALAATFAEWCAEYVSCSPEERATLRVSARIPKTARRASHDEDMNDAPTPDLVHSSTHETESESYGDDDDVLTPVNANPPAGLFSLGFNDVVLKIDRTPASDTMFRELPLYDPMFEGSSDTNPFSLSEPPILPVSKFVTGKLVSQIRGPPKKRSRFDYDSEDEPSSPPSRAGTSAEHSMPSTPGRRLFCRNDLPPEMTSVALFNAENKHVRDRLQAAHQFRPPTEFNMPSVAFFENRTPSQWLWEEDQKLRALVKEYTFNWSLVSQQLSLPSIFVSGSGRRTPWECFERWVQLEGLPAEMSKTNYFRQPRRRPTTTPIRVERRRENRHLAIIDGMRKLARKRESAAHKQAESQKAAALRKAHEPAPPKSNVHTPQEFSRLKWEREEKMKQRAMAQEMIARQQMLAQRQQTQMQAQPGMPNGINQMQRNGTPGNNIPPQMANASLPQGQNGPAMAARAHQSQQGMQANFANGSMSGMPMGTPGVPQAQMQGNMQNARMGPPDQMRMAMQRGHLTQGMGMNGIPNANMMASMPNQNLNGAMNGNLNNAMNGMSTTAGSPRISQGNGNMQTPSRPLSSGHMPQLLQFQNQLKVQHPDWTQEQVSKQASDHLSRYLAKQRSQAMNAAAGSSGISPSPQMANNQYFQQNGGLANTAQPSAVQNYQQQLVQQQRLMARQQGGSPGLNARPPSRSATPQNPQMQQSPGMQQAQINRS